MATAAAKYCAPDRTKECSLGMVGFVDDNGNQTNNDFLIIDNSETCWRKIFELTEKNAQAWVDLLGASGGALELQKCSYHMMRWQFACNGAPVLTIPDDLPDLVVRDPTEIKHSLQRLTLYDSHKTLGHYKEQVVHKKNRLFNWRSQAKKPLYYSCRCVDVLYGVRAYAGIRKTHPGLGY